ncbi:hypothetical protein M422DRAFT_266862 [Sphaerobolus stellatus SS14]|uniref:Uncharacterized protein n=1 Tax=Sphaerobolus stellatus (strain SS14) TaxID=990650 RepID=A0A0C9UAC1_SPHS4|nr:hypothetical protein M422DRAFT_266862 [Sphaerobolus stellatus SS14]
MPCRKASTLQWKQNLGERALKKQKVNNIETQEDEYLEFESPEIEFLELDHASNVTPSLPLELDAASNDSYESEFSPMDEGETDSDLDEEELQDDTALLNFTEKLNSGMAKYSQSSSKHEAQTCCQYQKGKDTETLRSQGYGDIQSYFTMKQGQPVQGDENMVPVAAELQRAQMREEAEEEEEEEESDGDEIMPGLQSVPLLVEEEEEIDLPADEEIDIWTSVHSSAVESNHNDTLNEQNKALHGINAVDPSLPIPSPSSQSLLLSTPSEDGNSPIIPIEIEYETAAEFETTEEDISEDPK